MEPSDTQDPSDRHDDCQPIHYGYRTAAEAVAALRDDPDEFPVDPDDPHLSRYGF